jgi:hypothetical protein
VSNYTRKHLTRDLIAYNATLEKIGHAFRLVQIDETGCCRIDQVDSGKAPPEMLVRGSAGVCMTRAARYVALATVRYVTKPK